MRGREKNTLWTAMLSNIQSQFKSINKTWHTHTFFVPSSSSKLFRLVDQYLLDGFFRFTFIVCYIVVLMLTFTRWIWVCVWDVDSFTCMCSFFSRRDIVWNKNTSWLTDHIILQLSIDYFKRSLPRAHTSDKSNPWCH